METPDIRWCTTAMAGKVKETQGLVEPTVMPWHSRCVEQPEYFQGSYKGMILEPSHFFP